MTTKTDTEQERADFEAWASRHYYLSDLDTDQCSDGEYTDQDMQAAWRAYQAGRAALQSQHETQLQVWRSTDSCGEFWSWGEADQYDYDRALPESRRVILIIKEG